MRLQSDERLIVKPRWPYHSVFITENAYAGLVSAQNILAEHNIQLILTRGYENQGKFLRFLHRFARWSGGIIFCFIYPNRSTELESIFSPNGNDQNGNCVNISILYNNNKMTLLPFGVFTNKNTMNKRFQSNQALLDIVWITLQQFGFTIHSNQTEALQIHCEFESVALQ